MYAVIRTGGKQYRVAPGDVLKVEKLELAEADAPNVVFSDVLAVSGEPGTLAKAEGATVTGEVLRDDRHAKVLVFHLKRKKQYKKLQGHRQAFTEVRIKSINV
jgi:large subunit ribosomal protein L21